MQITALSKSIEQEESAKHKGAAGKRGFLEIREELPFGRQMPWMCVGSVEPAGMEKIKVVLPAGSYHVRSIGASLAVFCLVYDIEAELS
ncbi:hypothetical protein AGDE_01729 [Angomonas deanei]|nr:hypothetical protein AGDE_01729 [Angomonas deanei]|eukprot:EPY42194.1 hypothetical protein AGDE_01729 [Angomonas deanei]